MVVLNKGKANEVALRIVLESERYGREYFDRYDTFRQVLRTVENLVKRASAQSALDGIGRTVSVAIVPKTNYGTEAGYGFRL